MDLVEKYFNVLLTTYVLLPLRYPLGMDFDEQLALAQVHLSANDAKLAELIKKYGPCRIKPHDDHYGELLSSIVSQQLSVKTADTIWDRVLDVFKGKTPSPQQLTAADAEAIRACGVSYQKISYMRDLANHIISGQLDLKHASTLPNQEILDQLVDVKGIGQWSAHMFLIFSLGRLDILPVGDLGIKKAAMTAYGLKNLPKPEELEKLSKKNGWKPYESVAAWYLWQSLDNKDNA